MTSLLLAVWCLVVASGLGLVALHLWDSARSREVERRAVESRTVTSHFNQKERH